MLEIITVTLPHIGETCNPDFPPITTHRVLTEVWAEWKLYIGDRAAVMAQHSVLQLAAWCAWPCVTIVRALSWRGWAEFGF